MNISGFIDLILQPAVLVALIGIIAGIARYLIVKAKERKSVNRALLSEISRLLGVIEKHKRLWEGCIRDGNTDLPLISFSTDMYDTFLKQWGDISPRYVSHATSFYGYVKFLNKLQETRDEHVKMGKQKMFAETYKNALEAIARDYMHLFDEAFRKYEVEKP